MVLRTVTDLELSKMLLKELDRLKEYIDMFDCMTSEEKEELREWMAHGQSVNNNPYLFSEENGCPMDLIAASRAAEDMARNPEDYRPRYYSELCDGIEDDELPF